MQFLIFAAFIGFWSNLSLLLVEPPYQLGGTAVGLLALVSVAGALAAPITDGFADRRGPAVVGRAGRRGITRPARNGGTTWRKAGDTGPDELQRSLAPRQWAAPPSNRPGVSDSGRRAQSWIRICKDAEPESRASRSPFCYSVAI